MDARIAWEIGYTSSPIIFVYSFRIPNTMAHRLFIRFSATPNTIGESGVSPWTDGWFCHYSDNADLVLCEANNNAIENDDDLISPHRRLFPHACCNAIVRLRVKPIYLQHSISHGSYDKDEFNGITYTG